MYTKKDSNGRKFKAWAIVPPWYEDDPDNADFWPVRERRTDTIQDFEKTIGSGQWAKYRRKGWKCVKVDLVIVGG